MQRAGFDPYAPPAHYRTNVLVPAGQRRGALPSPSLRVWKLVLGAAWAVLIALALVLMIAGMAIGRDGQTLAFVGLGVLFFSNVPLVGASVVGLVRLYRLWSWLPPSERYANLWRRYISPGLAVGLMLVPYFNFFWLFVIYLGTCEALERMRVAYPTSRPAPKGLAIATLILWFVFFPASLVLDYLFDKEIEAMAAEMEPKIPPAAEA